MILQAETVCAALLCDRTVKSIIGDKLFREMPPSEAAFPCVTYAESNSPALGADNAEALLRREVGAVFAAVLEHAGVYKCTPEGREAFLRFIHSV